MCITMHSLKECPRRTGLPWPGHITYSDMLRSVQLQGEPHRTVLLWHTYTQHADTWSIVPSTRDPECGVRQVLDSYWTSPFACQAGQAQCTAPARRKPALAFLQSGLPREMLSSGALALWSQKKKGTDGLKLWASNCYMCSHPCCDWWMVDKAKPWSTTLDNFAQAALSK